jgi:hypothetical protein
MRRVEERRHGHYDPRFWNGPGPGTSGAHFSDRGGLDVWENEGGASRPEPEVLARPPHLDWYAFSRKYLPGRRRHDLELLAAWRDRSSGPGNGIVRAAVAQA